MVFKSSRRIVHLFLVTKLIEHQPYRVTVTLVFIFLFKLIFYFNFFYYYLIGIIQCKLVAIM